MFKPSQDPEEQFYQEGFNLMFQALLLAVPGAGEAGAAEELGVLSTTFARTDEAITGAAEVEAIMEGTVGSGGVQKALVGAEDIASANGVAGGIVKAAEQVEGMATAVEEAASLASTAQETMAGETTAAGTVLGEVVAETDASVTAAQVAQETSTGAAQMGSPAGTTGVAAEGGESFVFRRDRSSVTPEQVFQNGFVSKGGNMDLLAHVTQPLPDSGFVATSESQEIATGFAGKNGYTFTIRNNGAGINVNSTLGGASPFPEQLEVAFPGNIPPENILGATSKKTGEFMPNPNYGGSR